ncbi:MAG: S8 family serine peptidase [Acidobacteriota bacterium]|nr:S8 family serine peptidase [Acidobacteriota bacterium]
MLFACCLVVTTPLLAQLSGQGSTDGKLLLAPRTGIANQYIVLLEEQEAAGALSVKLAAENLVARYGGTVRNSWELAARAFLVEMTEGQARELSKDPAVRLVEQNRSIGVLSTQPANCYGHDDLQRSGEASGTQAISCSELDPRDPNYSCLDNWGLDRIDQSTLPRDGFFDYPASGQGAHIYLIDTGIRATHADFFGRVGAGVNATVDEASPFRNSTDDCYGHGSHTAGIAAGSTYGVAKDAILHPVKFLDTCTGGGPSGTDSVMEGIEWILDTHGDPGQVGPAVVSFSGGNAEGWGQILATAAQNLLNANISFVQSAGNQADVAYDNHGNNPHPVDACDMTIGGQVPGMLIAGGMDINTVSGQDQDGRWLREGPNTTGGAPDPAYDELCVNFSGHDCGSNTGTCIDVWAPAAHINSVDYETSSGACRLSGTSMAAPHVAGAVALYLEDNPGATPAQVHQAIVSNATVGVLESSPSSPYSIGNSPNRLLNLNPGANQPPVGVADTVGVVEGSSSVSIPLGIMLGNDSDPEGDPLRICDYDDTLTQHGTLEIHVAGVVYRPNASFWTAGQDRYQYLLSDRTDCSVQIPVDVFLEAIAAPSAADDAYTVPQGTVYFSIGYTGLLSNDSPAGEIQYTSFTQPGHGTIQEHATGLRFEPDAAFWAAGSTTFTYTIALRDYPSYTDTATVTLTAEAPSGVLFEDGWESGDLSAWTAQNVQGGGQLLVSPYSAYSGTYGMIAKLAGAAGDRANVVDLTPNREDSYQAGFWFTPNSMKMETGETVYIFAQRDDQLPTNVVLLQVRNNSGYQIRMLVRENAGNWVTSSWHNLSGWTRIEVEWFADPPFLRIGGYARLVLDGVEVFQQINLVNGNHRVDRAVLGAFGGNHPTATGRFAFDDFTSTNN